MERLVSQRVREAERGGREGGREGRISLGGKVSGPVGVSSRVQSLCGWGRKTGKEGMEGGEGGEQPGSAAVWNMCRLDV